MTFCITSSAFDNNDVIPVRYTCRGEDVSPPLQWRDIPVGTKSLMLIVEDSDSYDPAKPEGTWVHWVLYNLPPQCQYLPEGVQPRALPRGARLGLNDWKTVDYNGPCLVTGRHRYCHTLYALDIVLPDMGNAPKKKLFQKIQQHVLEKSVLIGEFQPNS